MADPTANTPLFGVPMSQGQQANVQQAMSITPAGGQLIPEARTPKRHGIVDDTLGFLGDFLLSRLRMGTPYRDAKRSEKLQIASEGFDQNPDEAFKRMAAIDFNAASKFRDQYIDNNRLAAQNASTVEARNARLAQAQAAQTGKNRNTAASYMSSLAGTPEKDRPAAYKSLRDRMLNAYGAGDPELSNLLPEEYDPLLTDAFIDSSVPEGTKRNQRLAKERIDNQVEQAGADDVRADKTLGERVRHNTVQEGLGAARNAISERRAAAAANRPAKPARVTNVQGWVGEDGYKRTQRSDGSVVTSTTKVRAPAGKPAEGTRKVINGRVYVYRGGKVVPE